MKTNKIDDVIKLLKTIEQEFGSNMRVFVAVEIMDKRRKTPEEAFAEAILNSFSKLI